MKKYELLYAISSTVAENARQEIIERFKKFVEERGGKIEKVDIWGMKKLAYPIQFKNEGFYVLMNFEAEPTVIREMQNAMNITETIIRKMFVAQ